MPPAHGCPTFLIEPAFSARLSLKGDGRGEVGSPGMGRRLTRPEHYEQLKGQKCAVRLIRPDAQGRRDYAGLLQGLDADGNVTLTDGEESFTFPLKSAGYVKLCDDEDLFG